MLNLFDDGYLLLIEVCNLVKRKNDLMNNNINFIRDKNGSTLIWVLVMTLVLGLLIAGGLAIASSVSNRSVNQQVRQQAYYTAFSVTRAMASWLTGQTDSNQLPSANLSSDITPQKYLNEIDNSDTKEKIETFDLESDGLGVCVTTVKISGTGADQEVIISSEATYNGMTDTVGAKLAVSISDGIDEPVEPTGFVLGNWKIPDRPPLEMAAQDTSRITPLENSNSVTRQLGVRQWGANRRIDLNLAAPTANGNHYLINHDDFTTSSWTSGGNSLYNNQTGQNREVGWMNLYYNILTRNVAQNENIYFKLGQGTASPSYGFVIYSGGSIVNGRDSGATGAMYVDESFYGTYNRIYMYTLDSGQPSGYTAPTGKIVIAPQITGYFKSANRVSFRLGVDNVGSGVVGPAFRVRTSYKNMTLYFNEENASVQQSVDILTGIDFINTELITSRNTLIGYKWEEFKNEAALGPTGYEPAGANKYNLTDSSVLPVNIEGTLDVQRNTTTIAGITTVRGRVHVAYPGTGIAPKPPVLNVEEKVPEIIGTNRNTITTRRTHLDPDGLDPNVGLVVENQGTANIKGGISGNVVVDAFGVANFTARAGFTNLTGNLLVQGSAPVSASTRPPTPDTANAQTGVANVRSRINGDIIVSSGGIVNLQSGANINGNVYVKPGGELNIERGSEVAGYVYGLTAFPIIEEDDGTTSIPGVTPGYDLPVPLTPVKSEYAATINIRGGTSIIPKVAKGIVLMGYGAVANQQMDLGEAGENIEVHRMEHSVYNYDPFTPHYCVTGGPNKYCTCMQGGGASSSSGSLSVIGYFEGR